MSIDKLYCGICPNCEQQRGSLWRDRRTGEIVAFCVVCRRESHGPSSLTAGRGTTGQPPATGLVPDSRQPVEAACVVDISRCPTLVEHVEELSVLEHLGNVLHLLSDLHPEDRTRALDSALEFYNRKCPNRRIEPSGFPIQRLVSHQQSTGEPPK